MKKMRISGISSLCQFRAVNSLGNQIRLSLQEVGSVSLRIYCFELRNILGEVCTDQCARLSELYNQASRPGSNSGNSQNVEDTFSDHFDAHTGLIKKSHPMSISKIGYKMYHRDCFKCLEMDDCVPDCMDNGDCEEDWSDFSNLKPDSES